MSEQDGKDSKVIRLFPGQGGRRPANPPGGETAGVGAGDPEAVRQTIAGLLEEAEPIPPPVTARGLMPSPPGHPKAIVCSQCEHYTWEETRECVHCGVDRVALAEARRERRRRRWRMVGWSIIVGSWFVAAGCVYAMNHYYRYLPPKVRGAMFLTVLGIVGGNLFLLWITSEDNRRR